MYTNVHMKMCVHIYGPIPLICFTIKVLDIKGQVEFLSRQIF